MAWDTIVEGTVLLWVLILAIVLSVFALASASVVPSGALMNSLFRLALPEERIDLEVEVPAGADKQPLPVAFYLQDTEQHLAFTSFTIKSSENLSIKTNDPRKGLGVVTLNLGADKEVKFTRQKHPFQGDVTELYASNESSQPVSLSIHVVTGVEYPQSILIVQVAVAILGLFLLSYLMRTALPKLSAISMTTCKEAVSQPLFKFVMGFGAFALIAFIYIPYFTFGEDIKMLKTSGLTLIMLLSILLAMWTASVSVAEEIEGRTALTLLSKPISRRQFVIGKFFGLIGPIFLVVVFLGLLFITTVSYKVIYDARESVKSVDHWLECHQQVMSILPGLALAFMEAVVMASISVAISTRLPMIPNLIICSTIYVLGHLVPLLMESDEGRFAIVDFMGQLIATVFPVLDYFNIEGSIVRGQVVPLEYLGVALLYCALYCTISMLFALFLFEDRDLA